MATASNGRKATAISLEGYTSKEYDVHPSQVVVLDVSEWNRMKGKLSSWKNPAPSKASLLQQHKQLLHKHSQKIVHNWQNTIEGQRLKKLQARRLKDEQEEEERQRIDQKEAEFQAEERIKSIERAKTLLYYQTDRVKKLHGVLQLCGVTRERLAQQAYNERRQEVLQLQNDKFHRGQLEAIERSILKDSIVTQERAKEKAIVYLTRQKQVAEIKEKKQTERLAQLQEQKKLDEAAEAFRQEQKQLIYQKTKAQRQLKLELDGNLTDKLMRETRHREEEKEDEMKAMKFTQAKRQMAKLKKLKEAELQEQLQVHQKNIHDDLQVQMALASLDEDLRIAQAVQQQEAKKEEEEREKKIMLAAATQDIHKFMLQQMAGQEQRRREHKKMEDELFKMNLADYEQFQRKNLEKQTKKKQVSKELQEFYQSQMKELIARKKVEAEEDQALYIKNRELMKVEDKQDQMYMKNVMAEVAGQGGPLTPFHKVTKEAGGGHGPALTGIGVRPSFQVLDDTGVELPSFSVYKHPSSTQQ